MANYKIVNDFVSPYMYKYKSIYGMNPSYITIHNTANTASARSEVRYMKNNTNFTSYHVAVDDKEVVQALPFNRNAFHTGDGTAPNSGNRTSIGIEICYSMDNGYSGAKSQRYMEAEDNAALYAAHVLIQFGWGTDRLRQHYNWSGKDCPHKMRAHNGWGAFVRRVQEHMDAIKGGKVAQTRPSAPAKKPSKPNKGKSIGQMADEVIAGKHGSGNANRQKSLGVSDSVYAKVRAEVNRRAGVKTPNKTPQKASISKVAQDVINGKYGNGNARKRNVERAGYNYSKVQAEVNRILGGNTKPSRSIDSMARSIINNKNAPRGHNARQRWLGVDNATYQKVRARVNQMYK